MILGDGSSGKTRLHVLMTIGEAISAPPQRSRTTNIARGKVAVGGVEVTKWDRVQLKSKVRIILQDVRTLSDMSQLHSGLKLQDILRPTCPPKTHEGAIKSSMNIASQFTGLSTSLLPRLQAKLVTVVTTNEDDLAPTSANTIVLSSAEWSKVILTKLIAQVILTNDNAMSSGNSVAKSLVENGNGGDEADASENSAEGLTLGGTGVLLENSAFLGTQVVAIVSHESLDKVLAFVVSVLDLVRSENKHLVRVKGKISSHGIDCIHDGVNACINLEFVL